MCPRWCSYVPETVLVWCVPSTGMSAMVLVRASDVVGAYHCANDGAVWAPVWLFSIAMVQPWCWCYSRVVGTSGEAGASEDAIMTTVLYEMMDGGSVDTIDGAGAICGAIAHI